MTGRSRFAAFSVFLMVLASLGFSQGKQYATWSATFEPTDIRAGESGRVLVKVKIDEPWYMYGFKKYASDNPLDTFPTSASLTLKENAAVTQNAELVAPKPREKVDKNFNDLTVEYYEGEAVFAVPVKVAPGSKGRIKLDLTYDYQVCKKGLCDIPRSGLPLSVDFEVQPGEPRDARLAAMTALPSQPETPGNSPEGSAGTDAGPANDTDKLPLGAYLLFCFGAGLASLLLPCVFPMIPITVSFFSKQKPGEERSTNYAGAVAYCLGIISTFTGLGLLVTIFFGATGIQDLATNPWVNALMFLVFVALGLSLFGLFNIGLPSGLVNKLSTKSRVGGIVGPILMGLTFTLTSFTCTVPIVGALLVSAAEGDIWRPLVGMLAFSTAAKATAVVSLPPRPKVVILKSSSIP